MSAGTMTHSAAPQATAEERSRRITEGPRVWQEFVAEWYGRLVTIGGFFSILMAIFRRPVWMQWVSEAFNIVAIPVQSNLFVGAVLIMIGGALRRRLAAAFWMVIAYAAMVIVLSAWVLFQWAQYRSDPDIAVLNEDSTLLWLLVAEMVGLIIVVGVLLGAKRAFSAKLAPGSKSGALAILVGGLATSVLVTFALTLAFPASLISIKEKLQWSVWRALGLTFDVLVRHPAHRGHYWIALIAAILSIGALFLAASTFLRTSRARQFMSPADELHVRRLLAQYGDEDSLGYFATRRDKSVVFSPDGKAAVTYRVVASVSLASADPVGARESWPAAIAAWRRDARKNGWFPAVLSASEEGAQAYVDAGLKAIEIGDEAIIDVEHFNLDGRTMRQVRQAVTRVQRAGYTLQVRRHHEIPAEEMAHLEQLAEKGRDGATERGFSMAVGRLADPSDGRCVMATVHDADGTVRGLLSFVPWGTRGISLDLMRRDRIALNGLNEFMVAGVLAAAPGLGIRRMSLNFAMFRSTFSDADRVGAGPVTRISNALLSAASRFWQLETLYRSNAKYQPEWLPRYMCYDSSLTMTRTMIASGMAEGFLPSGKVPVQAPITAQVEYDAQLMDFDEAVRRQDDDVMRQVPRLRRLNEQQRVRRDKIARLADSGMEAYPVEVPRDTTIAAVRAAHDGLAADTRTGQEVSMTGRVRSLRDFGGLSFAGLDDGESRIQVMLAQGTVPEPKRGGASARPFRTHINAYNSDLYLRIAPELYLKRLCVGGMGKIFELNRNFRNEGADATHNPEFTSVEAYQAYADYNVMRELTQQVIVAAAIAVHGEPIAVRYREDGTRFEIRLDGEWPVIPVHAAVSRATGREITSTTPLEEVRAICAEHGIHAPGRSRPVSSSSSCTTSWSRGRRSNRPSTPTSRSRPHP